MSRGSRCWDVKRVLLLRWLVADQYSESQYRFTVCCCLLGDWNRLDHGLASSLSKALAFSYKHQNGPVPHSLATPVQHLFWFLREKSVKGKIIFRRLYLFFKIGHLDKPFERESSSDAVLPKYAGCDKVVVLYLSFKTGYLAKPLDG
ncbi:hypothetical protein L1987_29113 [Smallanthus sonchifolius]|uniref:Uncharacterized protein n=1 Tax=Smallanthus sonchifolius TaxID=185202 RepID=A0ACB9HZX5_9ASTR|nr:hypothetical protein L1987_29113 [Smallanthus sonchifolius]